MIEEFLKKENAASAANSNEVLQSLEGETIDAMIPAITDIGDTGYYCLLVFKSGCSFAQHSKGGYWVNNKSITKATLELELKRLTPEHRRYSTISALLEKL